MSGKRKGNHGYIVIFPIDNLIVSNQFFDQIMGEDFIYLKKLIFLALPSKRIA